MRTLPDGCADLVLTLGDGFEDHPLDGPPALKPSVFVFGPVSTVRMARAVGAVDAVGILFRPGRLAEVLRTPLSALTDRVVDATAFSALGLDTLRDELAEEPDLDRRLDRAQRFVERLLLSADAAPDRLVWAALEDIRRTRGAGRIALLAKTLGVSERTLERRFTHAVGLRPKVYARAIRFEHALHAMQRALKPGRGPPSFLDGFSDQAHLIREFRAMSGMTPRTMLAALQQELVIRGLRDAVAPFERAARSPPEEHVSETYNRRPADERRLGA